MYVESQIVVLIDETYADVIYITDFALAFDKNLSQNIVFSKLTSFGFSSSFIRLLLSYLFNRKTKMFTVLDLACIRQSTSNSELLFSNNIA